MNRDRLLKSYDPHHISEQSPSLTNGSAGIMHVNIAPPTRGLLIGSSRLDGRNRAAFISSAKKIHCSIIFLFP